MLFRTALGIHAARMTLDLEARESPCPPDWNTTLFLAIAHGHPGLAAGPIDSATLLAVHRQAWAIAGLKEGDPWKELLNIADPLERVLVASRSGFPLSEGELSSLVLEAVASQPVDELRAAVSLVLYLKLRAGKTIAATAAETLASQLSRVLRPAISTHEVYGQKLTHCREVASICCGLQEAPRDHYTRNLLQAFLPDGYANISPASLRANFERLWAKFGLDGGDIMAA